MNLFLTGKNITYVPNNSDLRETFNTILEEIIHLTGTIPRLYEKFGLPAGGLKKFRDVIQTDVDSNKLQSLIDAGKLLSIYKAKNYITEKYILK